MWLCTYTHTLPCEIRLICQWCRSSSMINSPACWKQCYSALATCGMPRTSACVFQCMCAKKAWISTMTSCSRHVFVVSMLVHKSNVCHYSCVQCTASQLCIIHEILHPVLCFWQDWQISRKYQRASKLRSVALITSDISGHLGLSDLGWEETSFSKCLS